MFGKKTYVRPVAEFLGSGFLTLVVIGVQHSTIGVPYFVGIGAALAAAAAIFMFGSVSGAHLNPVITLGLWSVRKIKTVPAIFYIAAQMLGAWVAYYVFTYHVHSTLSPVGGGFSGRILLAESIGTAILAMAWAATVYNRYSDSVKATVVGLGYAIGIVVASAASIGLINPAVALADRAWVWGTYVLGPVIGAVIGMNLYGLLFTDQMDLSMPTAARSTAVTTSTRSTAARKAPAKRKTTKRK
jgi:glycerol uptake facilitator protein